MRQLVLPREVGLERLTRFLLALASGLALLSIASVFGFMGVEAWPAFQSQGLTFLFGSEWDVGEGTFGALPLLVGSGIVTLTAMILALPFGLSAAIFTSEFLPKRFRPFSKLLMEILAGIPSVVYGLMGIAILIPWMQNSLDLLTGRTLLTGGIVLGIMILPTLMTVSEDALEAVPRHNREAGWTLGLNKIETIFHCVIPEALPGLIAASLLALGRALGETIAVMLLVGSLDRFPSPWYNWLTPGQTLTSKIGREAVEAAAGSPQYQALAALGLLLLVLVLGFTLFGDWLAQKKAHHR